jgi:endonuclease YncB( thermonuclease family)
LGGQLSGQFRSQLWRNSQAALFCALLAATSCSVVGDVSRLQQPAPDSSAASWTAQADCLAEQPFETVRISHVTDGDTVVLADERRVRIIGINTPELRSRNGKTDAYAVIAREQLIRLIDNEKTVRLYPGVDSHDRHGRTLAHLRLAGGQDVAAKMLIQGSAAHVAVAPNTRCAKWFSSLEAHARQVPAGLWQQDHAWLVNTETLTREHTGFHIVTGKVRSISTRGSRKRIELDNGLHISVDAPLAKSQSLDTLTGKLIEMRGWITRKGGKFQVNLHHAVNLRITGPMTQ